MIAFFRGWRRKIGSVALVMACVATVLWGRSLIYGDSVTVNRDAISGETCTSDFVASFQGELKWVRSVSQVPSNSNLSKLVFAYAATPRYSFSSEMRCLNADEALMPVFGGMEIDWKWRFQAMGFQLGSGEVSGFQFQLVLIPYWFLTLMLSLLAAYLILLPKRKRPGASQVDGVASA